ncbi:DNA/RNA nuclease SfsA [Candidatus Bathyarchaeota archaeon]|nr:DNA/RNA nuclease SfsA [Candidatus Bathyarchaeota archaeon]
MFFQKPLIEAIFLKRINRFLGLVMLKEKEVYCFIPNPGRMDELLKPGILVYLLNEIKPGRITDYDLILVKYDEILVSIDSRIPNILVKESIENNIFQEFKGYQILKTEQKYYDSRFDFLLKKNNEQLLLEVKSCTLVIDNVAYFPDAPTKRGTKHIKTLIKALNEFRSVILFLIQRKDSTFFAANKKTDPTFASALQEASILGVEIYAYDLKANLNSITLNKRVPLLIQHTL